jgi:hypothetical protein
VKFEIVTMQDMIENSLGSFIDEVGTGWDTLPHPATQPTMTTEDIMEMLEESKGEDYAEQW